MAQTKTKNISPIEVCVFKSASLVSYLASLLIWALFYPACLFSFISHSFLPSASLCCHLWLSPFRLTPFLAPRICPACSLTSVKWAMAFSCWATSRGCRNINKTLTWESEGAVMDTALVCVRVWVCVFDWKTIRCEVLNQELIHPHHKICSVYKLKDWQVE